MNISEHISYSEGKFSATATRLSIKNDPPPEIVKTMRITAENVFEPVRKKFSVPMKIISFYRSPALNKAVGGAKKSQHMIGEAIDVQGTSGVTNADIFHYLRTNKVDYDQIIAEFPISGEPAWIHMSYTKKRHNRNQPLIATKQKGKTVYLPYEGNEHLITRQKNIT